MDREIIDTCAPVRPRRSSRFGWTVALLSLTGCGLVTWIGCFYLFGHPEVPANYRLLRRLNKIDPPRRFELTAAPLGKFYTARELYDSHIARSHFQIETENTQMLHDFVRNFSETKQLVRYVIGQFKIIGVHELGEGDVFPSGIAAIAQSIEFPRVMIEHLYPTAPENIARLRRVLATGADIKLQRTTDVCAIVHVQKYYDDKMLFTVVPLVYGSYALGQESVNLDPPATMDLENGFPIVKAGAFPDATKLFATYRRMKGVFDEVKPRAVSPTVAPQAPLLAKADASKDAQNANAVHLNTAGGQATRGETTSAAEIATVQNENIPGKNAGAVFPAPPKSQMPDAGIANAAAAKAAANNELALLTNPKIAEPVSTNPPAPLPQIETPVTAPAKGAAEKSAVISPDENTSPPQTVATPIAAAEVTISKLEKKSTARTPPQPPATSTANPPRKKSAPPIAKAPSPTPAAKISPARIAAQPTPAPSMNISKNTPQLAMQTPRSKYVVPPPVAISEPTPNLEPFITAQTPPAAPPSRNWRLYKPGAMPRGRLVDVQDVSALTSGEWSGERVYLGGQFVVSASDGSRATLRPQKPTATRTRIIAEFPQGFTAPAEGATFERGDLRPFQITDVRTSSDGQVNIYVREITSIAPAAASADASTFAKNNAAQSQASFDFPRYRENETRNSFSPATNQFGAARTYPGAHFLVMASDQNRVVLRPEDASGQPIASTRIIVELPPGVTPPREGSTLARSDLRGYRVYVVNRGNDGQLNVYMRDTARAM